MSFFPRLLSSTTFSTPFLSNLLPSIGLAFTLQGIAAVPSILARTEKYYDLSGSLTYLSCVGLSLALPVLRMRAAGAGGVGGGALKGEWGKAAGLWNWRQVILSAAVGIWATRLGTYLFRRISADSGQDSRFTNIRNSPPKFLAAFLIQATWVSACLMPVLALNSIPAATLLNSLPASILLTDVLGLALYASGISLEVAADREKEAWLKAKREKKHDEDFLTSGWWGRSRHPNYLGEIMLWSGIAVVAGGVLVSRVGILGMGLRLGGAGGTGSLLRGRALGLLLAGISPAFVTSLLLFVSGIPLSEKKYDAKYGDREEYREWKRKTPLLVPNLFPKDV